MNPKEKTNYIPFIAQRLRIAKKQLVDVKPEKKDPNKIQVEIDPLKRPKMTPEELQDHFKANRGSGYHKNPKDKRSNNPNRGDGGW